MLKKNYDSLQVDWVKEKAITHESGEMAWLADDALKVIDLLKENSIAVLGGDIWVPSGSKIRIPESYIYTWDALDQLENEDWERYVERCSKVSVKYILEFEWDPNDTGFKDRKPYFNLTYCTQAELIELRKKGVPRK